MPNRQKPHKGLGTAYTTLGATNHETEPLKAVLANGVWDMLTWHIWGVISVSISIVLITLNLAQVAMDGEIGRNPAETANIIAGLQMLIQMHGLSVTASLFQIASQWIHGSLLSLDRGIPLALVGAERDLGLPSFVISRGYLSAVKYSASLWWGPRTGEEVRRKWDIGMVTAFLFVSCIVSVFAAPASGALMIPRVHWFLDSTVNLTYWNGQHVIFPHLIVPLELSDFQSAGKDHTDTDPIRNPDFNSELDYWKVLYLRGQLSGSPATSETHARHEVSTAMRISYVNTTTTWGRSMHHDRNVGSTYAKSIMEMEPYIASRALAAASSNNETTSEADHEAAMRRWSQRMYVMVGATAMVARVNCRYRQKVPCPPTMDPTIATWCLDGPAASSRSLILLSQLVNTLWTNGRGGPSNTSVRVSNTYIVEGDKSKTHPQFYESLLLVFDTAELPKENISAHGSPTKLADGSLNRVPNTNVTLPSTNVTVCSISTVLTPAALSAFTIRMDGKNVDCAHRINRTLQYHEQWLDYSSTVKTGVRFTGKNLLMPRSMVQLVVNPTLRKLGDVVNGIHDYMWDKKSANPAWLEITAAGSFISIFSTSSQSTSQYSLGFGYKLPESVMSEPRERPTSNELMINIYNQGYGFKLSSRVGILAVVLLMLHAVIVLAGSLWQLFWERRVIKAWSTVPEYLALGLGSTPQDGSLENTCAGITAAQSLRTIVKVGVTTPEHLELHVGGNDLKPALAQFDAKYGSRGKRRHGRMNGPKGVSTD